MSKKISAAADGAASSEEQAEAPKRDKKEALRSEIDYLKTTVRQAVIAGAVAIVLAVSTPIWAPTITAALNANDPASARVLVMAVEQLRPAISSSAPFEQQIALVRRMMADDREVMGVLERIEVAAPYGIPSSESVRSEFVALANQIFVVELFRVQPDERWINRALVRLASTIRPHDLAQALELSSVGPASALLAEAAHRVSQDDLGNAIRAIEHLPHPYAALASSWLVKAKIRYEAARALETLEALAAARLPVAYRR